MHALEGLLSPKGLLFKAMLSADAEGLINFIFPLERLPIRTQLLLRSAPGRYKCPSTRRSLASCTPMLRLAWPWSHAMLSAACLRD